MKKTNLLQRVCSLVIIVSLFIQQSGFAQVAGEVNIAGYLSGMMSNLAQDKFRPMHLRYLQYLPAENSFKLLVDKGDFLGKQSIANSPLSIDKTKPHEPANTRTHELNRETKKLMEYFAVGLRLSNESFWVNLRLDSPDNVIDDYLAQTDVGRIMLESDGQLKKDVSLMTSPETTQGKIYWDRLYKKAEELFGYENVTIPTLTRPWIVPGEVIISETADSAYIYKATLKVMLEEDYLKKQSIEETQELKNSRTQELNTYSTQLIKELIIPKLTQEVNSSKRYAELRQVYYSLIMAQWFKQRFCAESIVDSPLSIEKEKNDYINLINSGNLTGLTSKQAWNKQTYFEQYQKSFKNGEYNVKQTVSTPTGQVIRSYFSGGEKFDLGVIQMGGIPKNSAASSGIVSLPAVSSAINYNPEQMAAIKVNGELDVVNMREQDSGLSGQRTVSSSLKNNKKEKTFWEELETMRWFWVGLASMVIAAVWTVSIEWHDVRIKRNVEQEIQALNVIIYTAEQFNNDSAISNQAIDELSSVVRRNDVGADTAADALVSLILKKKNTKAFKCLCNLAGVEKNEIAMTAIKRLALDGGYLPAIEWLNERNLSSQSSLTPNPLASKILALLTPNAVEAKEAKNLRKQFTEKDDAWWSRSYSSLTETDRSIMFDIVWKSQLLLGSLKNHYDETKDNYVNSSFYSYERPRQELIGGQVCIILGAYARALEIMRKEHRDIDIISLLERGGFVIRRNGIGSLSIVLLENDNVYLNLPKKGVLITLPLYKLEGKIKSGKFIAKLGSVDSVLAEKILKDPDGDSMINVYNQVLKAGCLVEISNNQEKTLVERRPSCFISSVSSSLKYEKEIIEAIVAGLYLMIEGRTFTDRDLQKHHYVNSAYTIANEIANLIENKEMDVRNFSTLNQQGGLSWYKRNFNDSDKINRAMKAKEEIAIELKKISQLTEKAAVTTMGVQIRGFGHQVSIPIKEKIIAGYEQAINILNNFDTYIANLQNSSQQNSSFGINTPVGGIDFTAFPIVSRAVNNLSVGMGGVSMDRLLGVNLGREWQEIERMASSEIRVSSERLKEYAQASCAQDVMSIDRNKVLLCISDRLKQEEESCLPSEQLVIDMLAVFLSTSSQAQLRAVFIGN